MLTQRAFWYLRHGETDWNARNVSQGAVDTPLNETGLAQARTAAEVLRSRGIRSIVSSPLSRARSTAEIVGGVLGLPLEFEDELREVAFGGQEGQPMGGWFEDWVAGTFTPEGAEPFMDLRARAIRAINRALTRDTPVLVVAHGALFRALRAEMGLSPDIRTPNAVPYFCEPGTPWSLVPAS